ncbi:uncharacterized protein LOC122665685 [Telopea speciosissima]|uniref:uncharacterized protein LOC122665685 n=1 Tax=Telopea speciosissima TaxID=54955 RepID=UPI001CC5A7D2|nr:uncharacterized protein LOC122665685 [Telopea speciosissima]XP_043717778.1 uncharacterized protein LOC122665685 [Telopea speciosissima]
MGSTSNAEKLETLEVGPCEDAYQMGFLIGRRFSNLIKSRLATDLIFRHQLLPYAQSPQSQPLIRSLSETNKSKFPRYWDELTGTADGSGVPLLHIILLNFRKEVLPFLPKMAMATLPDVETSDDCSDVLIVNDSMAIAAHNEDANIALVGHTYLIKGRLSTGLLFTAYTYAGELPSCAFGFNSDGLAFTLNSVPPSESEIVPGGIARNFISRDLLEATSLDDALSRIHLSAPSVGHSYNLVDVGKRKILNVETASRNRVSVHEVGMKPFFHANMYLHLQVEQVQDENSISRERRAAQLPIQSKADILSVLGDVDDERYPIYMTGPTLYTLCTVLIDLDEQTLSIIQGNPQKGEISHAFAMSSKES